ncbi:15858_t:CDS:2 [Funneliformis geosporum]|uniref:15858_t:CDS:1 n=1 Tax=Funneliformis geosporum TaxID=1117311 RepID=A0A9W4WNI7_9GLOM|nr:15858_t:CDS:2 [Funneliformis geosporum]
MVNAQKYINQKFLTKEENQNLTELNLSDLSNFPNLEKLDCSFNEITSLNLTNCPKLTELKYAFSKALTYISISNNNFSRQDLSAFSKFTNLENLYLGNDIEERIEKGIINRFHGFLKPLKNFPKLKELQVEGTDIHLLDNLKIISKEEAEKLRRTNRDNFSVILNDILINYAKKELGLDLTAEQEGEMEKLGSDIATSAQAKNVRLEEKIQGSEDKDGKTELTSTSITVAGGALTLLDYSTTGGVITLVAPLIGILKQVQIGETGIVNIALKNLKNEVDIFLKEYDKDGNEEIDIDELTNEREKFVNELIKLEEVAKMMKNLEKEVINYRQGSTKKELETQPQIEVDISADKQNDNQTSLNQEKVEEEFQANIEVNNQEEIRQRQTCDYVLYTITQEMLGFYAIAEVVDDSNKRPTKTIFCYLEEGFEKHQIKSLQAIARMVKENGAKVFTSLEEVAEYLNGQQEVQVEVLPK